MQTMNLLDGRKILFVVTLLLGGVLTLLSAQQTIPSPVREMRGVWLTTIYSLDYPSRRGLTPEVIESQKRELCRQLDQLSSANFNAVFFQVRLRGDLLYPSEMEPLSNAMTGRSVKSSSFDPVRFAIDECHRRGLEFHAWFVVFPLGSQKYQLEYQRSSLPVLYPSWCKLYQGQWYLNPANPAVRAHLSRLTGEFVRRYDVDGVHLDYVRYPDKPDRFPDQADYRAQGAGRSLAEWRRNNVTLVVNQISDTVKSIRPWVQLSCAVIGRYKRSSMNDGSSGWTSYDNVYQDPVAWMNSGKVDFIVPMLYFSDPLYSALLADWLNYSSEGRVYAGVAVSNLEPREKNWTLQQVLDQVIFARRSHSQGIIFFRAQSLLNNSKQVLETIKKRYFERPSLVPSVGVVPQMTPPAPYFFKMIPQGDELVCLWSQPYSPTPITYNLYFRSAEATFSDSPILIKRSIDGNECQVKRSELPEKGVLFVRSFDRFRRESLSSNEFPIMPREDE